MLGRIRHVFAPSTEIGNLAETRPFHLSLARISIQLTASQL
jgi:hypothetical protein